MDHLRCIINSNFENVFKSDFNSPTYSLSVFIIGTENTVERERGRKRREKKRCHIFALHGSVMKCLHQLTAAMEFRVVGYLLPMVLFLFALNDEEL